MNVPHKCPCRFGKVKQKEIQKTEVAVQVGVTEVIPGETQTDYIYAIHDIFDVTAPL